MTSRGAACRPLACPWTPCYPACLSDAPASVVPVAVFVPVSAAVGRVSARVAGAAAVVSDRPVAGVVVDVAGQRFAEALSAAPEPAAARLAGAAVAGFVRLSAFWHPQDCSAESSSAPLLVSARFAGAPDP